MTSTTENVVLDRMTAIALADITRSAQSVRRLLEQIKRDAVSALNQMDAGYMPNGGSHGPLGSQAHMDLVVASARLNAAALTAGSLGIDHEVITAAYRMAD